jgi:Ca-activated chloride channel family protein
VDVLAEGAVTLPANWFANPWAFWLLATLPVLGLFAWLAWRRQRKAVARLGFMIAVQALRTTRGSRRWLRGLCLVFGLVLLIAGIAGPQWGRDYEQSLATGRDLVVVLDQSRSMLAQDVLPSRQARAKQALRDLSYTLQKRGGHRLALVIFAAEAEVVCPLTHDYDHFRYALARQDAATVPLRLRPKARGRKSGTSMGTGLKTAVEALQSGSPSPGVILMVSDGDDPARDEDWYAGARLAQEQQVPVFTVGVGNPKPKYPTRIPFGEDFVRHPQDNRPVETRLEEKPLMEIARITKGTYVGARTEMLNLGALFKEWIEPHAMRTEPADLFPSYVQRYPWFFGAALVLLSAAMLIGQGRVVRDKPPVQQEVVPAEGPEEAETEAGFEEPLELVGAQTGEEE